MEGTSIMFALDHPDLEMGAGRGELGFPLGVGGVP